jgi:hypothetical protein
VTQAATDLAVTEKTESLCRALADAILHNQSAMVHRLLTTKALPRTLKFEDASYRDLGDFALQVATALESEGPPEIAAAARALYDHLQARGQGSPVLKVGFLDNYERASGMSVYLPDQLPDWQREQTLSIYRQLYFPQRTGWDNLVAWMVGDG